MELTDKTTKKQCRRESRKMHNNGVFMESRKSSLADDSSDIITESFLSDFFSELNLMLQVHWESRPIIEQYTAERFNMFDYVPSSEISISRIMADLFRTDGSHGQRDLFLRLFMEEFFHKEYQKLKSHIWTEYPIANRRRLDMYGKFSSVSSKKDHFLALENKPYAGEGGDQVSDYIEWLQDNHPHDFTFIFLAPTDQAPKSIENSKWRRLCEKNLVKVVTYMQLSQWLEKAIPQTKAEKMRWFLMEFNDFITNTFDYESNR